MLASALFALLAPLAAATSYPLTDSFSGANFLDGWDFPASKYDNTTNGDVFWATASNTSLLYANDAGKFIMKVDNETSVVYNDKRYAPELLSKKAYGLGTVFVLDADHVPYGCGVWPAFWTRGADWPNGGEIDILEGVNMMTKNQMAIHTAGNGCYASSDTSTFTGSLANTNCSTAYNFNQGCSVTDASTNSYGADFATAGGGVYVAEYASEGIKLWFITRASVPSSLTVDAKTLDTSTLGTPTAYYPSSSCDISKFFTDQVMTLTITLCGDWAGAAATLEQTCGALNGTNTCYTTYVINDQAAALANAYFEINYVNVYTSAATTTAQGNGDAAPSGTGATASDSTATTGATAAASSKSTSAAARYVAPVGAAAGAAAALALLL